MAGTRYLVRRVTKEVFIWTEALEANHKDLEEVIADSAEEALTKKTMPDPRRMSIDQLEVLTKRELLEFAKLRLGMELDGKKKLGELQDEVKVAIFTQTRGGEVEEVHVDMRSAKPGDASTETLPRSNARAAAKSAGA